MNKLTTKQKREADKRRAFLNLWEQVLYIATGACGYKPDTDHFFTATELSRFIPALKDLFPEAPGYVWFSGNLSHFENVDSAAEFISVALMKAGQ